MRTRSARLSVLFALLFVWLGILPVWSEVGQSSVQDTQFTRGLKDYTDKLSLREGLSISFPIYRGIDTQWKQIGDYEFHVQVVKYGAEGLTFDWTMSYPADAAGSRAVNAEDLKESTKVSLFYPKRESCTLGGFTNAVRVSDAMYKALKQGRKIGFELDGPEAPAGHTRDPRFTPHSLESVGHEFVPIRVNDKRMKVKAIKATADNGWLYWIMDNPDFPMLIQGNGPFGWGEPRFDTAALDAADASQRIIKQLEEQGVATTHAILFDFNKDTLKPRSKPIIDQIGSYLNKHAEISLEVEGHTDSVGSLEYNLKLSQRRAQAVKDYLVNQCGIAASRLTPNGLGFTKPVATNSTAQGRAQNRRVVFRKI